jgi:hypothetical protein
MDATRGITIDTYEGHRGIVEANVYQRTEDYPDEWFIGYHVGKVEFNVYQKTVDFPSIGYYVMLDSRELVMVRSGQVETLM